MEGMDCLRRLLLEFRIEHYQFFKDHTGMENNFENVETCEGLERINSPETYKQWQARNLRNGFRHLQLDQELLKRAKEFVKNDYHKDFVVDKHGQWILQGWRGKIIYALSFWKPI
ncbi:hypothetical protein Q3G72_013705 [Acer saccharum]|nr:hypothetical protein Q3G72_013705 [Acer saccharum]